MPVPRSSLGVSRCHLSTMQGQVSRLGMRDILVLGRRIFGGGVLAYVLSTILVGGSPAAPWVFYAAAAMWTCSILTLHLAGQRERPTTARSGFSRLARGLELVLFNVDLAIFLGEAGVRLFAGCAGRS